MSRQILALQALSAMEQFIHDNNLLTMYPEDFQVHDRALIESMPEWDRFLWMVDETFTYLFPIGLHQNVHEVALQALECRCYSPSLRLCWIYPGSNDPIEETDLADVRRVLLDQACYQRKGMTIVAPRATAYDSCLDCGFMAIRYEFVMLENRWLANYSYAPKSGVFRSLSEAAASVFASYEISKEKGLWTRVVQQDSAALYEILALQPDLVAA